MSDTETAGKTGRSRRLSLAIAVLVGIVIGAGGYAAVSAIVGGGSISVACARVAELEQATAGGPHFV